MSKATITILRGREELERMRRLLAERLKEES